jgi:hypothetical protein
MEVKERYGLSKTQKERGKGKVEVGRNLDKNVALKYHFSESQKINVEPTNFFSLFAKFEEAKFV